MNERQKALLELLRQEPDFYHLAGAPRNRWQVVDIRTRKPVTDTTYSDKDVTVLQYEGVFDGGMSDATLWLKR